MSLRKLKQRYDFSKINELYARGGFDDRNQWNSALLVVNDTNLWNKALFAFEGDDRFKEMNREPIDKDEFMAYLMKEVHLASLLNQRRVLITNVGISQSKIIELREISSGNLRVVCLGKKELSDESLKSGLTLKNLSDLLDINKTTNHWFAYSDGKLYLEHSGYIFQREVSYLGTVKNYSKTLPLQQEVKPGRLIVDEIFLHPGKHIELNFYESMWEMFSQEKLTMNSILEHNLVHLSDVLPDEMLEYEHCKVRLIEGYEVEINDDLLKITHEDSPYAVHASIRKDDTKHEIYISDKDYDGDVTSLYNLNEGYASYGSCLAQEISFMLRTIVMNAELFNNQQYSTFVITIQDKTKTVNQNFISLVVETIADVAKLTPLNSNLPVMTSLYNSKVILKVLLPDGSPIFIEPA